MPPPFSLFASPRHKLHRKAWLEVSDVPKHRYGKNLRVYYKRWVALSHPHKSFFDWLDSRGTAAGHPLPEAEECSREKLDEDTVEYVTDGARQEGFKIR